MRRRRRAPGARLRHQRRGPDNLAILGALEDAPGRRRGRPWRQSRSCAQILALLGTLSASAGRVGVDPTLARGLDYYTGPVFEATVDEPQDRLAGRRRAAMMGWSACSAGATLPTVGMSLGLERLIDVMTELHMVEATRQREPGLRRRL